MRKKFEQQLEIGITPISEVTIRTKSRHELPKLLIGLQHIFVTPELNDEVFTILSEKVLKGKKKTGRMGMSLWEILVLGAVRLNLDINYDMLEDLANNHIELRQILGVHKEVYMDQGIEYKLSTLKQNIRLLDEQTLSQISEVVVKAGHSLKKKELGREKLPLNLKTDTYAVESNIHFPTDINLLWDSMRSCLRILALIGCLSVVKLKGWRNLKWWLRELKRLYRITSDIHRKKGKNYAPRLKTATKKYLYQSRKLSEKIKFSYPALIALGEKSRLISALVKELVYYHGHLDKHVDLVNRRILQGEKIPHEEKVFSIFEPHVEWLQKGKPNNKVELGHNVLLTTDQYQFIVDHYVVEKQVDKALLIPLVKRLEERFGKTLYELLSLSTDKGFYTVLGKQYVAKVFKMAVVPKKGKRTAKQEEEEHQANFIKLRHDHSAVESNINELEHSGLNKVPDKTFVGFKKYVAFGVLAHNLKRLGRMITEQQIQGGCKYKKAS